MAKSNDDVLEFSVAIDIRDSLKEILKFQKQMAKLMKDISKTSEKTSKDQTQRTKKTKKETDGLKKSVDGLTEAYEREETQVGNLAQVIAELEKRVQSLQGTERAAVEERLTSLKKEEQQRIAAEKRRKPSGGKTKGKKSKKDQEKEESKEPPDYSFSRENLKKFKVSLKASIKGLKEPIESVLSKDLKSTLTNSVKSAGKNLRRSVRLSKFLAHSSGEALSRRGEQASFRGKKEGGAKGRMIEAGGAGMKAMGSMMSKLGGVMNLIGKLGPILSAASGLIVGLVQTFLDADAAVKEFNHDIMQSAGNLSLFSRSGRDVDATAIAMEHTLEDLRGAALDYQTNLSFGITKDDHKAMITTLNQEGVSLGRIRDEAKASGKTVRELATQFTVTGVAYSRAFGVSLAEVSQFQATMMTEMGKSADETKQAFALMARGAADSSIASNKFFATISAMSSDLGLFNLRMEDSVALLSKISKVMSPQSAQKFMQTAVQGLKTMGRQEKLRLSLFAGSKETKQIVDRDIKRKTEALAESIAAKTGESAEELVKAFEGKGFAGIKSSVEKLKDIAPELQGTITEKALDLDLQQSEAKKGDYGVAMASGRLDIGGALEVQQRALMKFSKGQYNSIADAKGSLGLESVAEALGIGEEQVDQLAKLEVAIKAQRDALGEAGKSMGYDQVIASMTDELRKSLALKEEGNKMEDLAKRQGDLTQSLNDKFGLLVDWMMNQFYAIMMDIWNALSSILHPTAARDNMVKRNVVESGNKDMLKALRESGGDMSLYKGKLLEGGSGFSGGMHEMMGRGYQQGATLHDKHVSGKVMEIIDAGVGKDVEKIMAAAGAVIKDEKRLADVRKAAESGEGLTDSLNQAGVSGQERQQIMGQAAWQLTPEQLTELGRSIDSLNLQNGGARVVRGGGQPAAKTGGAAPGTPAVGPASPAKAVVVEAETSNEHLTAVVAEGKKQQAVLETRGVKIAPSTIKEETKGVETAMLSALRVALFEYYMYSGTDRSTLLAAMESGGVSDPREMAKYFGAKSRETGTTMGAVGGLAGGEIRSKPNAAGGMVTGVANGMAMVAAHGEGLASVGKGERIMPAGGGAGGGIHINVNGIGGQDLQRLIEGKVVDGIREYKRRERLY